MVLNLDFLPPPASVLNYQITLLISSLMLTHLVGIWNDVLQKGISAAAGALYHLSERNKNILDQMEPFMPNVHSL